MTEAILANTTAEELSLVAKAASEALTDSMVERLSVTAANALEIVDRLNDDDTRDAVHTALSRLTELHRSGALDTLFDLVVLMHAAREASTDSIVERLCGFIEKTANSLASDNMVELADSACAAFQDAASQAAGTQTKGGMLATLSLLSKPESQRSLQFLLNFGASLEQRCTRKT